MLTLVIGYADEHYHYVSLLLRYFRSKKIEVELEFCDSERYAELKRQAEGTYGKRKSEGCPHFFVLKEGKVVWAAANPEVEEFEEALLVMGYKIPKCPAALAQQKT